MSKSGTTWGVLTEPLRPRQAIPTWSPPEGGTRAAASASFHQCPAGEVAFAKIRRAAPVLPPTSAEGETSTHGFSDPQAPSGETRPSDDQKISPRGPKISPSKQKKYIPPPEKNISFGAEKIFPAGQEKIFPAARSRRRGLRFNCVPSGLRLSCKRQKIRENISTTGAPASAEKHAKSNVIFPRRPK